MKDKKLIIILILVLVVGVVGLTIAYFSNSTTLNNQFQTNPYGTTYTESFVSPENWLPGTTTAKTIIAENTGEVDEAVRLSISESWTTHNNGTLNGWIHTDGTKSTHTTELELANDERVAVLNLANTSDWTKVGNYYYYNYKLAPGDETTSFLESVTFNSKTKLDDTCEETITATGRTITCNSSGEDYDNATYTLTFNIETVQYNKYQEVWGNNYNIAESKPVATVCSYEIGDEITYDDANYYVIRNSDNTVDYVVALKKDLLTASEVNTYSTDYVSQDGEYPYLENSTCYREYEDYGGGYGEWYTVNNGGCTSNYDESNIKNILDNWSSNYNNDLVSINGYKIRLVNIEDVLDYFNYEIYDPSATMYNHYVSSSSTPEWVVINGKKYWAMANNDVSDSNKQVRFVSNYFSYDDVTSRYYIRPVINLKKSAIESACPTH